MSIEQVYETVQNIHDARTAGCRGGSLFLSTGQPNKGLNSGCFYGVTETMKVAGPDVVPYVIFNGSGPEFPFEVLWDRKAQNKILQDRKVSWNEFVGTEYTKPWVSFLISDKSPWWKLNMYFHSRDVDYINNAGFIFQPGCGSSLPTKLLYNFCMAMRFCWDQPVEYAAWLRLCELGYEASYALFLVMNFKPVSSETWMMQWPWNFLEDGSVECAYRFIHGLPATLGTTDPHNPNVVPLWAVGPVDKAWIEKMSKAPMKLDDIFAEIDPLIDQQKERTKCVA